MNVNKNLVIVTYDMNRGAWLETEIEHHYKQGYNKIFVFNTCTNVDKNEKIARYAQCSILSYHLSEMIIALIRSLGKKIFWKEIVLLFKSKRITWCNLSRALIYLATSIIYADKIEIYLQNNGIGFQDEVVFYSYWMSVQAESLLHLRERYCNSKFVTRCHRVDIYEEEQKDGYLEYREPIFQSMDYVYCVSEHGKNYLEKNYALKKKFEVSYLGSLISEEKVVNREPDGCFKIVSCSTLTPVKRVENIASALSCIKDIDIIWHHYGDGPLKDKVNKAITKLPPNIQCELKGNVPHEMLMKNYAIEKYDLFITASASEGIPVSIMEAISLGIPILATDVGGVGEIVYDRVNGVLLPADVTIIELAKTIKEFALMDMDNYKAMQLQCIKIWKNKYDAIANYSKFARDIANI